jgi:hypothetical protein
MICLAAASPFGFLGSFDFRQSGTKTCHTIFNRGSDLTQGFQAMPQSQLWRPSAFLETGLSCSWSFKCRIVLSEISLRRA